MGEKKLLGAEGGPVASGICAGFFLGGNKGALGAALGSAFPCFNGTSATTRSQHTRLPPGEGPTPGVGKVRVQLFLLLESVTMLQSFPLEVGDSVAEKRDQGGPKAEWECLR